MKIWNYLRALSWKAPVVASVVALFIGWWLIDWPDEVFTWCFWTKEPEDVRNLVLTLGAPVAVTVAIIGLILARHRTRALLLQAETDAQGHITDRFTKAIEQLGNDKRAVRLGAIYALERIAEDSPRDHWPIMETLTAFVRKNAPNSTPTTPDHQTDEDQVASGVHPRPEIDIQAALTVLGRRGLKQREQEQAEGKRLDLSETNLSYASLAGVHLENANLWRTCLDYAYLRRAHLEKARLGNAHLAGAILMETHLENAILVQAYLAGADLLGVHFDDADLLGANLTQANLHGTNLAKAKGLTQSQIAAAYGDMTTILPRGLERPEHWSEPT